MYTCFPATVNMSLMTSIRVLVKICLVCVVHIALHVHESYALELFPTMSWHVFIKRKTNEVQSVFSEPRPTSSSSREY